MNRLGLYVFYDPEGILGKYVKFQLSQLATVCNEIIVICNGSLKPEDRDYLESNNYSVRVRENVGFEATAWKECIQDYIDRSGFQCIDEIVFSNDIAYGPLIPLSEVFEKMGERNVDFWGITKHFPAADFTQSWANGVIPTHIQTYFFVVRKRLLHSPEFIEFWKSLPRINNYLDDIGKFETRLTHYFEERGFRWDVYTEMDDIKEEGLANFCANYEIPFELVKKGCPFIRRKALTQYVSNSCSVIEKDPARLLDSLKNNNFFDEAMIYNDLLRKNNLFDLYSRNHWKYILPTKHNIAGKNGLKCALFMHIYYEDELDYCLSYAKNFPVDGDVYITCPEQNKEKVREKLALLLPKHNCNVLSVETRGRDVSAFLVGCRDILESTNYDAICVIHDKKSPQVGKLFGQNYRDATFDNMLFSKEYVENVVSLFAENPKLGYLGFPKVIGGPYWWVFKNSWSKGNFENTKELIERCGLNVKVSESKPPFSYGNVFWCKPQILSKLLALNLDYSDFPKEPMAIDGTISHSIERIYPLLAQDAGFYSGTLYTEEYASIYLVALEEELRRVERERQARQEPDFQYSLKELAKYRLKNKKMLFPFAKFCWKYGINPCKKLFLRLKI